MLILFFKYWIFLDVGLHCRYYLFFFLCFIAYQKYYFLWVSIFCCLQSNIISNTYLPTSGSSGYLDCLWWCQQFMGWFSLVPWLMGQRDPWTYTLGKEKMGKGQVDGPKIKQWQPSEEEGWFTKYDIKMQDSTI